MSDISAPYAPPSTARDVIVTLPDGREAYGYYLPHHDWQVFPNDYPGNPLDLNIWNAQPCAVIGWHDIEPVYA